MEIFTTVILALAYVACAQYYDHTTPVPILKHINRQNEDGSYSYGYENADGSYKIETKHTTGEVFGKYGYVDDTGSRREVEYGASRRGFEPAGAGINVPPPTLQNNYVGPNDYDDGQYREDPSVYYKDDRYNSRPSSQQRFQSQPQRYNPPPQQYNPPPQQYNPPPPQQYNPPPQQNYNSRPRHYDPPQEQYNPPPRSNYNNYRGNPSSGFNGDTGSYSVTFTG